MNYSRAPASALPLVGRSASAAPYASMTASPVHQLQRTGGNQGTLLPLLALLNDPAHSTQQGAVPATQAAPPIDSAASRAAIQEIQARLLINHEFVIVTRGSRAVLSDSTKRYINGLMSDLFDFTFDLDEIPIRLIKDAKGRLPPCDYHAPNALFPDEYLRVDLDQWLTLSTDLQLGMIAHEITHAYQWRAQLLAHGLTLSYDVRSRSETPLPNKPLLTQELVNKPRTGPNKVDVSTLRYTLQQIAQLAFYRVMQDTGNVGKFTDIGYPLEPWHPPYIP